MLWAQGWHGLGTWWMNQSTAAMALETPLGECGDLPLEVDQEGVQPTPSNDFDGAVGDMGLV